MNTEISNPKRLKSLNPEYINFVESFCAKKDEKKSEEKPKIKYFLVFKKLGFLADSIFDIIKAILFLIILGNLLKIVYPLSYSYFGKSSFITGIPFLRVNYLLPPMILQIILFIISFGPFNNKRINEKYTITKYFSKLNFLNTASFILKIFIFYFVYKIYLIINTNFFIKFSGHILATLFSCSMIISTKNICNHFISNEIQQKNFKILAKFCDGFILHNLYCLVFTTWIYHSLIECLMGFVVGSFYLLIIDFINFDQIFMILLYPKFYNLKSSKIFKE